MPIVRLSTKGQLVIPAELRQKLGLTGGTYLRVEEEGGALRLTPLGASPVATAYGALAAGGPLTPALLRDHAAEGQLEERKADRWTPPSSR